MVRYTIQIAAKQLIVVCSLLFFFSNLAAQHIVLDGKLKKRTFAKLKKHLAADSSLQQHEGSAALRYLEQIGYPLAHIKRSTDTITIALGKPVPIKIVQVDYLGDKPLLQQSLRRRHKGFAKQYRQAEQLIKKLHQSGYPFAALRFGKVYLKHDTLFAYLQISSGQKLVIDELLVLSESIKNKKLVETLSDIKKGELFSLEKYERIQQKINEQAFLQSRKAPVIYYIHNKASINIYAEKQNSNKFNGIIGLSQQEDGKLELNGQLQLSLNNLIGQGESLQLDWSKNGEQLQNFQLALSAPYWMNTTWGTQFSFGLTQIDSSYSVIQVKPSLSKKLSGQQFIYISYENERVKPITATTQKISTNLWGLGYRFKRLDSPVNPRAGVLALLEFSAGNRQAQSSEKKYRWQADFQAFIPTFQQACIALKNNFRAIYHTQKNYSLGELYRLGGFNTLRGFYEEEFLASLYNLSSIELRYLFEEKSNAFCFLDIATLIDQEMKTRTPWGIGVGVNLNTKAGILGLSYAVGKRQNSSLSLKQGKLHFGYVNFF